MFFFRARLCALASKYERFSTLVWFNCAGRRDGEGQVREASPRQQPQTRQLSHSFLLPRHFSSNPHRNPYCWGNCPYNTRCWDGEAWLLNSPLQLLLTICTPLYSPHNSSEFKWLHYFRSNLQWRDNGDLWLLSFVVVMLSQKLLQKLAMWR